MLLRGKIFQFLTLLFSTGVYDTMGPVTANGHFQEKAHTLHTLYRKFLNGERELRNTESEVRQETREGQILPGSTTTKASSASVEERQWNPFNILLSAAFQLLKKPLLDYFSGTGEDHERNQSCFNGIGCFNYADNMSLPIGPPESPEKINTTFYFFTNNSRQDMEDLLSENKTITIPNKTWTLENWTAANMTEPLNTSWPMMVVTHGFLGSKRTLWMLPLVRALIDNMSCTVLVVDWEVGANGTYRDVAMNSPMVGVLISMFLQKIIKKTDCAIGPDNITLIGFSLGAQVMGFAGRHFHNATTMLLARIAGLDPAGYLFDNNTVALSKRDAQYVDVIHTHAGKMEDFKLGLDKQVGHVDFYPNGGSWQPGCYKYPTTINFTDSLMCSHYRAAHLFIESLTNRNCSFTSYRCDRWEDYKKCKQNASPADIGLMGYYSFSAEGRGKQYLETNKKPPYCLGNKSAPPDNYDKEWTMLAVFVEGRDDE